MFVRDAFAQTEPGVPSGPPTVDQGPPPPTAETLHIEEPVGGFPPLETEFMASQLLWLILCFGVLYWVMSKVLVPRLAGIIEGRHDRIALDLDAAERMRGDADAAQAAYEQELAEARERSHSIAQGARDTARAEADEERKSNELALDRRLDEAQARIGEIKAKALADVDAIAEETTEAIVSTLAGLSVPREEIAGAVSAAGSRQEDRHA